MPALGPSSAGRPESAIEALYAAWAAAFGRGDVDSVLALLTPDDTLWAPAQAPVGREALRPQLAAAFAAYQVVSRFERIERFVSGDVAVDCGWDVHEARPRAGGPSRLERQRVLLVLRREPDGPWRFARGMTQPGPTA